MRKADKTKAETEKKPVSVTVKKILKTAGKGALALLVALGAAALATFLTFITELFGLQTNQDTKALTYCIVCIVLLLISNVLYFFFLRRRRKQNKKMPYLATASYIGFTVGAVFMLVMLMIMAADPYVKPGDEYQTGKF